MVLAEVRFVDTRVLGGKGNPPRATMLATNTHTNVHARARWQAVAENCRQFANFFVVAFYFFRHLRSSPNTHTHTQTHIDLASYLLANRRFFCSSTTVPYVPCKARSANRLHTSPVDTLVASASRVRYGLLHISLYCCTFTKLYRREKRERDG